MHGAKEVFQASDSSAVYKCGKADLGGGGGYYVQVRICAKQEQNSNSQIMTVE